MSTPRRCDIIKATDSKWYLTLGNFEYAEALADCTTYGPFASEDAVEAELDLHSNPGMFMTDASGRRTPPRNPQAPTSRDPRRW